MNVTEPILVNEFDHGRLLKVSDEVGESEALLLKSKLSKALIIEQRNTPRDLVTMNSRVCLLHETTDYEFSVTLVYPHEVNGQRDRIAITQPAGLLLLGSRVGQLIDWPIADGVATSVRILLVDYQPEAEGDWDR